MYKSRNLVLVAYTSVRLLNALNLMRFQITELNRDLTNEYL